MALDKYTEDILAAPQSLTHKFEQKTQGDVIGLSTDTGIGMVTGLEKPGELFYYGALIVSPVNVNKEARYHDYDDVDNVLKRVSLLVGVALGGLDDAQEGLLLGGSVIIAKRFRFSLGAMRFKLPHPNPLVTDTESQWRLFVSASPEIDAAKLLQALVGVF